MPRDYAHLPLDTHIRELSPTVRAMLEVGERIVREQGFKRLTLEAVANEAGVSKSTLVHQFGSRAGYITTLYDSLLHEECVALGARVEELPHGPERIREYIGGLRSYTDHPERDRVLFDIVAGVMADDVLRRQIGGLYAWYREICEQRLGIGDADDAETQADDVALAAVVEGAIDGLGIQTTLDPDGFDAERAYSVLSAMVALYLSARRSEDPPR